jgi:hypothetical protein
MSIDNPADSGWEIKIFSTEICCLKKWLGWLTIKKKETSIIKRNLILTGLRQKLLR